MAVTDVDWYASAAIKYPNVQNGGRPLYSRHKSNEKAYAQTLSTRGYDGDPIVVQTLNTRGYDADTIVVQTLK